jgi:hypothetical protein
MLGVFAEFEPICGASDNWRGSAPLIPVARKVWQPIGVAMPAAAPADHARIVRVDQARAGNSGASETAHD